MDVKPRTTRWRDTLPDVTDRREHRDLEALDHLSTALRDLRDGHENSAYEYAGTAAAHVRAWRTSLNHEAARRPDYPDRSDTQVPTESVHTRGRARGASSTTASVRRERPEADGAAEGAPDGDGAGASRSALYGVVHPPARRDPRGG